MTTVSTDDAGFYGYVFKHTGKKATYTVELYDPLYAYVTEDSKLIKPNGYAYIEFTVP